MRKKLRTNMFDHKNYDANLDQPEFRAVVNKVYDLQDKPSQQILDQPVAQYITETGVYKNMNFRLCDVFNEITIAKEKAHQNDAENKKAGKMKERRLKNKKLNANMLPDGVKMFNEVGFIKELTEIVEEKKDV